MTMIESAPFIPFLRPQTSAACCGIIEGLIDPYTFELLEDCESSANAPVLKAAEAIHRSLSPALQDVLWVSGGLAVNWWTHDYFLQHGLSPMSSHRPADDVDFYIPFGRFRSIRAELEGQWEVIRMWEQHGHMAIQVEIDGQMIRVDFTSFEEAYSGEGETEQPQFTLYPETDLYNAVPTIWPPTAFNPNIDKGRFGNVDMRVMSPTGLVVLKTMFTRQEQKYRLKDVRDIVHLIQAQPTVVEELLAYAPTSQFCADTLRRVEELLMRLGHYR